MDMITLTNSNIETEHICCIITEKKGEFGVSAKKAWLKKRFADGLVFKKLNARGKVFIEYIPAEYAWCPIHAEGYMFINCFWVAGQFKGKGYANKLLEECLSAAKAQGKKGIVVLSSKKKMPFLSDPIYLKYKGFEVCDAIDPYYELLYLPFNKHEKKPRFKECVKQGQLQQKGLVLYYSDQCPYTEKYSSLAAEIANARGAACTLIKYQTKEQAQNAPAPFTTYSLFFDGEFITNEILSEKKILKLLDEKGL